MKFVTLKIKEGLFEKVYNFSDKCLIYSDENSRGKTTLLRMLLFALGYNIPPTKKISFSKYEFELEIFTNKKIVLTRRNSKINVVYDGFNDDFILPQQEVELHSMIFEIGNFDVVENLLGCFYLDQEKGWTLLNKGTVIGRIPFNIKSLVRGISNIDCKNELIELSNIQSQIQKYTTMLEVAKYQNSLRAVNTSYDKTLTVMENLEASINDLKYKQTDTNQKIEMYNEIIKNNRNFMEYIINSQLIVVIDGKDYKLTKDNIKNYNDVSEFAKQKRKLLQIELKKIKIELTRLYGELDKHHSLVSGETILDQFNSKVSKITINENAVLNTLDYLKRRKRELESIVEQKTKYSGNAVQTIYNYVKQFAAELNFSDYIEDENIFIFTSDLKGLSGAVLHKLVFIFKMAYIKLIEDTYGLLLPIILDSPKGKEVDSNNVKSMMKVLKNHFVSHQIIIASIEDDYDIDLTKPYIILDKNGVLGSLESVTIK